MKIYPALLMSLSLVACNQKKADGPAVKPKTVSADSKNSEAGGQKSPNPKPSDTVAPVDMNKAPNEPKPELVSIIGNWQTDCQPVDLGAQTAISPVKSTKAALSIESETKASLKLTLYTDNKCATAFLLDSAEPLNNVSAEPFLEIWKDESKKKPPSTISCATKPISWTTAFKGSPTQAIRVPSTGFD